MRVICNIIINFFVLVFILMSSDIEVYANSAKSDFTYELVISNGVTYASLKRYLGNEEYVRLPDRIGDYPVIGIGNGMLFIDNFTVKTIYIPENIVEMPQAAFSTAYNLERFILEKEDLNGFHTIDGVLYFENNLVAYPPAKEGNEFIIPEGTHFVFRSSIYGSKNLKKVVIPSSVAYIGSGAFSRSKQSIDIFIKKTNIPGAEYLNLAFWEMAVGTKVLVNNEKLKQMLQENMTDTQAYADHLSNPRIMDVEVGRIPAESLAFTNGETNISLTLSKGDSRRMQDLYVQSPVDTTELVSWTSSDPAVATVDMWGKMQIFRGGEAEFTGRNESGHTLTIQLTAEQKMDSFALYGQEEPLETGEERVLTAEILPTDSYAEYMGIAWKNTNPSVVQMTVEHDKQIRVKGIAPGIAELTGTVNDNGTLVEERFQLEVTGNIRECVTEPLPDMVYRGTPLRPRPVLRFRGILLQEGIDYVIADYYANNMPGTGTIVVQGKGSYRDGQAEAWNPLYLYFRILEDPGYHPPGGVPSQPPSPPPLIPPGITPVPPQVPDFPLVPSMPSLPQNPDGTDWNQKLLSVSSVKKSYTKDRVFVLKAENGSAGYRFYSSNKKVVTVGKTTGKVTIKGTGLSVITVRSGAETAYGTVVIVPVRNKIKSLDSLSRGRLRMNWQTDRLAHGYQIQLSSKKDFSVISKTWNITEKKAERKTISSPFRKKTVYVRVRSYMKIRGITYYGSFSKGQKIRTS